MGDASPILFLSVFLICLTAAIRDANPAQLKALAGSNGLQ
jgi:hypothetical protein